MRIAKYEELESISLLMNELFYAQMQEAYTNEGQEVFLAQITQLSLEERFRNRSVFYIDETINTVLEIEGNSHIAFLFSKEKGQGNAHKLCNYAFKKLSDGILTVGAFSEAIGFYEKEGFIKIAQEQVMHGLAFTLMAKTIIALEL